jgi:hypothetical protein
MVCSPKSDTTATILRAASSREIDAFSRSLRIVLSAWRTVELRSTDNASSARVAPSGSDTAGSRRSSSAHL